MAGHVIASWTMYDRLGSYGSPRTIVVYADNTATITMHNVVWYTVNGPTDAPNSIDPDGGPCFGVGMWLRHDSSGKAWKISSINYYTDNRAVSDDSVSDDMEHVESYLVTMSVVIEEQ